MGKILSSLIFQKEKKIKGSLYHYTQINFTYNSNRIEGSKLTEDETRYIYETNTIFADKPSANIDDIVETSNHFYLFNRMLETAEELLTDKLIKEYHRILKNGTSDSRASWFNVGEYKKLENEVGGLETTHPKDVSKKIEGLIEKYNNKEKIEFEDILEFHYNFEIIHPFQDGNGRIGRLIMFKECLKNDIVPFIIEDEYKAYYYRGLAKYKIDTKYLEDTCLMMQDKYKLKVEKFLEINTT